MSDHIEAATDNNLSQALPESIKPSKSRNQESKGASFTSTLESEKAESPGNISANNTHKKRKIDEISGYNAEEEAERSSPASKKLILNDGTIVEKGGKKSRPSSQEGVNGSEITPQILTSSRASKMIITVTEDNLI